MHPCITTKCGCLYASLLKTLGVHFIRHPCLTRKLRVLAPAAPKSRAMPVCGSGSGAGLSNRACSVGFASCETLGKHYHASLRLRSLGSLHRAATLCDRHRASLHDPHSASSPPSTKKSRVMPVCGSGSGAGCRIAVVGVGASLRRLCATAIVHPCTSCLLCWFRILASSAVWVATSCGN
mgnify:CR=1 FL=1